MTPFNREYPYHFNYPQSYQHFTIIKFLKDKQTRSNIVTENENGTPPRPLSRRKKREAEAAAAAAAAAVVLSEDRRRALEATYNGASAGEAREKLLQNPSMSLGPGLHLSPTEVSTGVFVMHLMWE